MKIYSLILLICSLSLLSCKKTATETTETPIIDPNSGKEIKYGIAQLEFQHFAGSELLALSKDYVNSSNETFKVSALKYYVSNVTLIKKDGSKTLIPDTYFLIDASKNDASSTFGATLRKVPEGNYSAISFMIGVDSAKTVSGALAGDLAPEADPEHLEWVWEGYIGMYFTGTSPSSNKSDKTFAYRVFGHKGIYNALQTININFGSSLLMVKQNAVPSVHLYADILEFFKNPTNLSIAKTPETQRAADSTNQAISKNYADMFRLAHIHN